ncbi:MAG: TonB-dependent receptor, partial [Vicinamibacterales bacterium]|nr:TonB-dependent receptor [Vicinamibacterales bacterium]
FSIEGVRNPNAANGSSLQGGAGLPSTLRSARSDTRFGSWFQDRWQVHPRLTTEAGVRVDRSTINGHTYVSPRLAATWAVLPGTRVRGGFGIHRQSPGYEKLSQADYFMDLTSGGPLPLDSERARHVLVSLEHDLRGGVTARLEGYVKHFDDSIIGRLETADEQAARQAQYDFPAALAWSVPTAPLITTVPTNDGRGHAWGVDVYLARRAASSRARLNGWASYTYGVANRTNYGREYPFEYDRRHAVSVVADLRVSRRLRLSAVARLATGFPYTPVRGLRVTATPDLLDQDGDGNVEELIPQRDATGLLVYEPDRGGPDNMASGRLPFYGRLDTRITLTPDWGHGRVWFYLDAINATRRTNAGVMTTTLEHDPGTDRPRLVNTPEGSMPFIPSIGVHVDFTRPRTPASQVARPGGPFAGKRQGLAVGLQAISSLGSAVELAWGLSRHVSVRGAVGVPQTLDLDVRPADVRYDLRVPSAAGHLRLDWHPRGGRFRAGGGLVFTRGALTVTAREASAYTLGGASYAAVDVGTVTGEAPLRRVAPHVGVGWGRPVVGSRRFSVGIDAGVALRGAPFPTLRTSGALGADATFRESLAREARTIGEELRLWEAYPVVAVTLAWRVR